MPSKTKDTHEFSI